MTRDTVLFETRACRATSAISVRPAMSPRSVDKSSLASTKKGASQPSAGRFVRSQRPNVKPLPENVGPVSRNVGPVSRNVGPVSRNVGPSCSSGVTGRRSASSEDTGNFRVIPIFYRALDHATDLALGVNQQVKWQRCVRILPGRLEPIFTLTALFEPVARVQARAGLAIQKVVQLTLVVVERYEREPECGPRRLELLLEAEQPGDLFFARCTPGGPEVEPGPLAAANRQGLGQLGRRLGRRSRDVLLRHGVAGLGQLAGAQRARFLGWSGLRRLDRNRGGRAECRRAFWRNGLAALVRGHRRVLLGHGVAGAQDGQRQPQRETQSLQSTHDTNALRLMASSSHLRSPRELGHEQ